MARPLSPVLLLGLLLGLFPLPAGGGDEILAEVGGKAIRAQDVDQALGLQLSKLHEQIYELKKKKLEELITEELLKQEAAKRGLSVQQLLVAEVDSRVGPVLEQEIEKSYQQNKDRLRGPEEKVRERIRSALVAQRTAAEKEVFLRGLRAQERVVVHLTSPAPVRVPVSARADAAVKGPLTAPVAIVEFSDFQCPYCRHAVAELAKVVTVYSKDVQLIYRHFPVDRLHPQARLAAQAAECAGAQGRFWEYHDRLFEQAENLSADKLKALAVELRLDPPAFERCLNDEWARTRVTRDVEAGIRAGVSGTPTFFINGRPLVGAQPFPAFKAVIEQELAILRR